VVVVDDPIVPSRNVCMPAALVAIELLAMVRGKTKNVRKAERKKWGRSNKDERRITP
jgi:hypothetical protein